MVEKSLKIFAVAAALTVGLAGCGVRGPLEPPPKASSEGTATSGAAADAGENSSSKPEEHRPFILDGLLR